MKKKWQVTIILLCLCFIAYFLSKNRNVLQLLLKITPMEIILLVVLNSLYLVIYSYRYKIVLEKCSDRKLEFTSWFKIFVIGRFLNTIIPQSGNLYRSVFLNKNHKISYTRYVCGFFSFAWMDTLFNILIAMVVILTVKQNYKSPTLNLLTIVFLVAVLFVTLPGFVFLISHLFVIRNRVFNWLNSKITEVLRISIGNIVDASYMARFFLLGLLVFFLSCLIFWICFLSIGVDVGLAELVIFYVFLKLNGHINITPGNVGVQEIGFGVLSQYMQIGMTEGMLVSAIIRVVSILALMCFALPMGGVGVLRKNEKYRSPL